MQTNMTRDEAIELLYSSIHYPEHISNLDTNEDGAIRFVWRTTSKFRFDFRDLAVETVGDGVLDGSNIAILLKHILGAAYIKKKV